MPDRDTLKGLLKDRDLWKLIVASVIGGLMVAWLAPIVRNIPPK